jgi:UDPglucose--hexose-1-phosphate uridylyltransferase
MPELRKDPIIGRWVIIATERAKRPSDFKVAHPPLKGGPCPFCPGNEDKTPREVLAYRGNGGAANAGGWSVRVVPNKFPALMIEGGLNREGVGMFDKMNGVGAHEVVIESPSHEATFPDLTQQQVEEVCWAWRDRVLDLKRDQRFRYILIFKNWGEAAGASLEHPHTQLIALPIVPRYVHEELRGANHYFDLKERCIWCDIIRQEQKDDVRIVHENEGFIAVAPWAPRSPFETWVMPKEHQSNFEDGQRATYSMLADCLRRTLKKLDLALERPPYNFILHTLPLTEKHSASYHWHVELMPTLTKVAGFEWGSGFYINPTPPEEAARFLRKIET